MKKILLTGLGLGGIIASSTMLVESAVLKSKILYTFDGKVLKDTFIRQSNFEAVVTDKKSVYINNLNNKDENWKKIGTMPTNDYTSMGINELNGSIVFLYNQGEKILDQQMYLNAGEFLYTADNTYKFNNWSVNFDDGGTKWRTNKIKFYSYSVANPNNIAYFGNTVWHRTNHVQSLIYSTTSTVPNLNFKYNDSGGGILMSDNSSGKVFFEDFYGNNSDSYQGGPNPYSEADAKNDNASAVGQVGWSFGDRLSFFTTNKGSFNAYFDPNRIDTYSDCVHTNFDQPAGIKTIHWYLYQLGDSFGNELFISTGTKPNAVNPNNVDAVINIYKDKSFEQNLNVWRTIVIKENISLDQAVNAIDPIVNNAAYSDPDIFGSDTDYYFINTSIYETNTQSEYWKSSSVIAFTIDKNQNFELDTKISGIEFKNNTDSFIHQNEGNFFFVNDALTDDSSYEPTGNGNSINPLIIVGIVLGVVVIAGITFYVLRVRKQHKNTFKPN